MPELFIIFIFVLSGALLGSYLGLLSCRTKTKKESKPETTPRPPEEPEEEFSEPDISDTDEADKSLISPLKRINKTPSYTDLLCETNGTDEAVYIRRKMKKQEEKYLIDVDTNVSIKK